MKTNIKLSTKILLGIAIFLLFNVVLTAFLLRQETDKIDLNEKYRQSQKLMNQSFKHIVLTQSFDLGQNSREQIVVSGVLMFREGGSDSVVTHVNSNRNRIFTKMSIVNDTLFVEANDKNGGFNRDFEMDICANNLQSITTNNISLTILGVKNQDLRLKSFGNGEICLKNSESKLLNISAQIHHQTTLRIDSSFRKLQRVEIDMKDFSNLIIPDIFIEKFIFRADSQTKIEVPSRFLKQ